MKWPTFAPSPSDSLPGAASGSWLRRVARPTSSCRSSVTSTSRTPSPPRPAPLRLGSRLIEAGMRGSQHERVTDRLSAIRRAIELAADGDIVLLAGKGHETYQVRGTTSYPFDEKEIVKEITGGHA